MSISDMLIINLCSIEQKSFLFALDACYSRNWLESTKDRHSRYYFS